MSTKRSEYSTRSALRSATIASKRWSSPSSSPASSISAARFAAIRTRCASTASPNCRRRSSGVCGCAGTATTSGPSAGLPVSDGCAGNSSGSLRGGGWASPKGRNRGSDRAAGAALAFARATTSSASARASSRRTGMAPRMAPRTTPRPSQPRGRMAASLTLPTGAPASRHEPDGNR